MKNLFVVFIFFITSFAFILPVRATDAPTLSSQKATAYIIKEINVYRASYGLPLVQTSDETCRFAIIRAKEISTHFSHDGFTDRQKSGTLPYKHWSVITENIAMTSDYREVEKLWEHSPGHAKNMRADTPYVCVKQYGNYFAYLGMRPK